MRNWARKKRQAKIAGRVDQLRAPASASPGTSVCFRYTQEQLSFLRDGFATMRLPDLTAAFNAHFGLQQTEGKIKSTLKNHRITCGRKPGNPKGFFRILSKEQAKFVEDGYKHLTLAELTDAMNRQFGTSFTVRQLRSFTRNHAIRSGRTGQFEKGAQSWNKGVKGYMGANRTSFTKGRIPHTKKRLWSERVNRDGFIEISIPERNPYTGAPTRFKHKHVWIWEAANGPVPKGHAVIFADGDKMNCVLENLLLVTRAELLSLNLHGYKDAPDETRPALLTLARIEAKAGIRTRPGRGRRRNGGS